MKSNKQKMQRSTNPEAELSPFNIDEIQPK